MMRTDLPVIWSAKGTDLPVLQICLINAGDRLKRPVRFHGFECFFMNLFIVPKHASSCAVKGIKEAAGMPRPRRFGKPPPTPASLPDVRNHKCGDKHADVVDFLLDFLGKANPLLLVQGIAIGVNQFVHFWIIGIGDVVGLRLMGVDGMEMLPVLRP